MITAFWIALALGAAQPGPDWSRGARPIGMVAPTVTEASGRQRYCPIRNVVLSADDSAAVLFGAIGQQRWVFLAPLPSGQPLVQIQATTDGPDTIRSATFSPNGRLVALASAGRIDVRSWPDGGPYGGFAVPEAAGVPFYLAFAVDGRRLAAVTPRGMLLWESTTTNAGHRWRDADAIRLLGSVSVEGAILAATTADGGVLAVVDRQEVLTLFDLRQAKQTQQLQAPVGSTEELSSIVPPGWRRSSAELFPPDRPSGPSGLTVWDDGRKAAYANAAGSVFVASDGIDRPWHNVAQQVERASVSPDGQWCLAMNEGGAAMVSIARRQQVWHVAESPAWCEFSPTGRWLLAGYPPATGNAAVVAHIYAPAP